MHMCSPTHARTHVVHDLQGRLGVQLRSQGIPVDLGLHSGSIYALHRHGDGESQQWVPTKVSAVMHTARCAQMQASKNSKILACVVTTCIWRLHQFASRNRS
jgi:hypothetical protein